MSSTSDIGISPVLLLAVSQSLTSTTTKNSSPKNSPTKMSERQPERDNNNGDVVKKLIKTQMIKGKTENKMNGEKVKLSESNQPFGDIVTTEIDMASVLTTLAAQNQLLQEPEQSPVFQLQLNSTGESQTKEPVSSAPGVQMALKEECSMPESIYVRSPVHSPKLIENSAINYKTTANKNIQPVKRKHKSASVSSPHTIVKAEPNDDFGDRTDDIPAKTVRLDNQMETLAGGSEPVNSALNSEIVKTLLKMRLSMQLQTNVNLNELLDEVNQSLSQSSSEANTEAMLNVLTSLAIQNNASKINTDSEPETSVEVSNKDSADQNKFIISYDSETGAPQLQGIIVSDGVAQVIDQSGNRLLIQSSETLNEETVNQSASEAGGVEVQSGSNVTVYTDPNSAAAARSPCPVCGDTISGFHYGIFTCESCKGFFKRTVQNKKTFLCHRQGECEINLENRKKCPACRFAKCLVMGMKLEAIRADRTRGGRSSYTGTGSTTPGDLKVKANMCGPIPKKKPATPKLIRTAGGSFDSLESSQGGSHLVAVLNNGEVTGEMKPFVPQILTDIMNLESLLCEDDIPPEIGGDRFNMNDPSVFLTFLQLAELKLYKIVRWARNLPYFANISTDDQILLLQNCWCELLTLHMCWKSMHLHNEVIFLHGQSIDEEKATILGIQDMFHSILELIDHMRRLHLDQYECVALKVIILICPDMRGLKDADKLGEQQQRISGALETYTNTHYRQSPNKFGELIIRLSELSRISFTLKGHLVNWMPPNSTSCGLLFELLKGENMKELC